MSRVESQLSGGLLHKVMCSVVFFLMGFLTGKKCENCKLVSGSVKNIGEQMGYKAFAFIPDHPFWFSKRMAKQSLLWDLNKNDRLRVSSHLSPTFLSIYWSAKGTRFTNY